jgi:Ca-activated chloride channel family protein
MLFSGTISAQPPKTRILFLLDASYSMNKSWNEGSRWQNAMKTMIDITDSIASIPNVEFGLRIYGHQFSLRENNCKDSRLELPFGSVNKNSIRKKLAGIQPNGVTPIAYSLEKCVNDFALTNDLSRNFLIVITDGEESCGGDPCAITQMLLQNGIVLKPVVLGIQLPDVLQQQFNCIGELINTNSGEELQNELTKIVMQTISKTTFQLNLLDESGKPTETDVAFSLIDAATRVDKYHFHHTLNDRGLPDTIAVSPLFSYNFLIHTQPPLFINNVVMKKNEHNIVATPAPQGFFTVRYSKSIPQNVATEKIKCILKICDTCNTLLWLNIGDKEKLLTGSYIADILTTPPIANTKISINSNKTTEITVPAPGIVTINKSFEMFGAIFMQQNDTLIKVYDLDENLKQEIIPLQPNNYIIVYRSKFAKSIHNTIEKKLEVTEGSSASIKL